MPANETTSLTPQDEARFKAWANRNRISDVDAADSHYDYRGYWKENGDKSVRFGVDHFPDTYKQHGHPTFSVESKYSKGSNDGGRWDGERFIPPTAAKSGGTLAQKVRAKYPGAYDDLTDQQLEAAVRAKHPGVYDDIPVTPVEQKPKPSSPASPHVYVPFGQFAQPEAVAGHNRAVTEAAQGARGALAQTVYGGGDLIRRGWNAVMPSALEVSRPIQTPEAQSVMRVPDTPAGTLGKIGADALLYGRAGTAADALTGGARLATRAAAQGVAASAVSGAQTGGDPREMAKAGVTAAAAPVAAAGAIKVGKFLLQRLPENLYRQVFRTAEDDLRKAWMAQSKGAPPPPSLARQAIDEGLMGSHEDMALYSIGKLDDLEARLQKAAGRRVMSVPDKSKYITMLDGFAERFGGGFLSDKADEAKALADRFRALPGPSAWANDVLTTRRFLDRMRLSSSFRMDPSLNMRQEELKIAADRLRGVLHRAPDMSPLIQQEQTYVRVIDALGEDAQRRENRAFFNLIDAALSSSGPQGVAAAATVRGLKMSRVATTLGSSLDWLAQRAPSAATTREAAQAAAGVVNASR